MKLADELVEGNWFRVPHPIFETNFTKLATPATQLVYVWLWKYYNRYGDCGFSFYRSDQHFSRDSGLSIATIKRARKKLKALGLVEYRRGHLAGNRGWATHYTLLDPLRRHNGQDQIDLFARSD